MPRRLMADDFIPGSIISVKAIDRMAQVCEDYIIAEDLARQWVKDGVDQVFITAAHPKVGYGEDRLITMFMKGQPDVEVC